MCLPALALLGTVISGVGAAMGAAQQASAYRAQAEMHKRQSILEREKGVFDATQQTKSVQQRVGESVAAFASNGVDVSSGSPLKVVSDIGTEGALDVAATRFGARVKSDNELYQAKIASNNASMASAAIPFSFLSPIISGASKIQGVFG